MQIWNSRPDKIKKKRHQRTRPGEGRLDKRKKVSPWISNRTAEVVHDVARYITRMNKAHDSRACGCSDGEAAHRLVTTAFFEKSILRRLAVHFWRDYWRDDCLYPGHMKPTPIDEIGDSHEVRSHIRFTQEEWRAIGEIAFATGTDIAPVVGALLTLALEDEKTIEKAAPGFRPRSFYSLKEGTTQWR